MLKNGSFLDELKLADEVSTYKEEDPTNKKDLVKSDELQLTYVIHIHKKEDPITKKDYKSISLLSLLLKIFKRVIYSQLAEFSNSIISKLYHMICLDK